MSENRFRSPRLRRRARRFAAFAALGGALPLLTPALGVLAGCGSEDPATTTGRRVRYATRVELTPGGERFTTAFGWSVTLTRAYVASGAFRYFDGVPPIATAAPMPDTRFARWLGLRTAHAHPGHYQAGNVLGEMLVPSSVDLLAGTTPLAGGEGVSGWYRSAEKAGAATRWFRAVADLAEVADSAPRGEVDGCVFEAVAVESDGVVTVRVSPSAWFTLVDFGELEAGEAAAPREFPAGSQPRLAFAQGVAELSAYRFSFVAGEPGE